MNQKRAFYGWAAVLAPLAFAAGVGATSDLNRAEDPELFKTSDRCLACHKGVSTSDGVDVSIGYDWRASMMANSARDPYWQAAVRREVMDHPGATAAIEAKCSRCHMPMANEVQRRDGVAPTIFQHLPVGGSESDVADLAADGVSCAACHQIAPEGLGTEGSFTGEFTLAEPTATGARAIFGPFEPDAGGAGIMHSATGFQPQEGTHIQSSALCASCHTLFTHAVRPDGTDAPEFSEQVPFLEWQASAFAAEGQNCQSCHMPEVGEDVPVTAVLGRERPNVSRHVFRGGNFFMLRMLARYAGELGVVALPQELALAADRTEQHLQESTARLQLSGVILLGDRLHADVEVVNLAGHKFPTAYPSRRAWVQFTVRDGSGHVVFESGAPQADGSITGNDNDENASVFEPHHQQIETPDQVQVYEAVMVDGSGSVTTGLMSAERWAKDNRLLPRGYESGSARTATYGAATQDADFMPAGDRVRYSVDVASAEGPFTVEASLWFQPIGYRWALNLEDYDAPETNRFVRYYRDMASGSALRVASDRSTVR